MPPVPQGSIVIEAVHCARAIERIERAARTMMSTRRDMVDLIVLSVSTLFQVEQIRCNNARPSDDATCSNEGDDRRAAHVRYPEANSRAMLSGEPGYTLELLRRYVT